MKKINQQLIDKLLLIIMSAQTFIMGVAFVIQICRIYFGGSGGEIFSRNICAAYLKEIMAIMTLWIILIFVSSIYFSYRKTYNDPKSKPTNVYKLNNLMQIAPMFESAELAAEYQVIKAGLKKQKIAWLISIFVVVICSLMGIGYLVNPKHFDATGNINMQIKALSVHLLPWVIIAFLSLVTAALYEEYSAKKLIELVKLVIKNNGRKTKEYLDDTKKKRLILIAQVGILLLAVTLIIVGAFDGGAKDVLQKAINICTECIGLG